jgi:hypothetical protein
MLTLQAIQGIQFVFNVSFFFFRIELGTKTHGFRYFGVFLGNAVKAYCDWLVNFRTSLKGIPSHDTFGKVFGMLETEELEKSFLS